MTNHVSDEERVLLTGRVCALSTYIPSGWARCFRVLVFSSAENVSVFLSPGTCSGVDVLGVKVQISSQNRQQYTSPQWHSQRGEKGGSFPPMGVRKDR